MTLAAGASAIARLKGVADSKKAPPDNKPGESASPLTKKVTGSISDAHMCPCFSTYTVLLSRFL